MREVILPGLEIEVPPGSAFSCETPDEMFRLHALMAIIGLRGSGKTTYCVNLIEKLKVIDRLIIVSPSFNSNYKLMKRLEHILDPSDVYENINDITIVDDIISKIEKERDDLEEALDKLREWNKMQKKQSNNPLTSYQFNNVFMQKFMKKPEHKWNFRRPCIFIFFDDNFGSQLMMGRGARKIAEISIRHRHLGQMSPRNGSGAIGASLLYAMQSYKSNLGGLPKAIRGNLTLLAVGKLHNEKDLNAISEEVAGEIAPSIFKRLHAQATREKYSFLTIDFHPKSNHLSPYRRNLDTFIIVPENQKDDQE